MKTSGGSAAGRAGTAALAAFVALLASGCGKDGRSGDSAVAGAGAPAAAPPGRFAMGDLGKLRWIAGQWRGRMPNNEYFYERYTFVDDSTIVMHALSDPTFTRVTDSSRIVLRGGTLTNDGGTARWVATRLDSTGVDFSPAAGATNYFTWTRGNDREWTATLRWTDQQGAPQTVTYSLQRVGGR
jgi:hypothetical protein